MRSKAFGVFAAIALAAPTTAGAVALSGTFANTNPPAAPGGRCPVLTVSIRDVAPFHASGTSDRGAFTATQSHCLTSGPPVAPGAAPVDYTAGLFTYSFATGGSLSGTYFGTLTNGGPGVVDNSQSFVVTGGTGKYAGATGSFLGTGSIHFAGGPPAATLTFTGAVFAPGVPEPDSWLLMIAGLAAVGIAQRRRSATVSA